MLARCLHQAVGRFVVLLSCFGAGWAGACGGSSSKSRQLSYGESAKEAYYAAMKEFRQEDCLEAEPGFQQVRKDFPFSRFAALSELRIADCLMIDKKYPEAAQAYQRFARFHPSHEEVPYAEFRTGVAHIRQIPRDWFLMPPSHERDQGAARDALRKFNGFLRDYPEDRRVPEAKRYQRRALKLLAAHELYVAEYYLKRENPKAALMRLETLASRYGGTDLDAQALWVRGQAYAELGDDKRARQSFGELVRRFPNSREARKAREKL